jgi:hypothetical protein
MYSTELEVPNDLPPIELKQVLNLLQFLHDHFGRKHPLLFVAAASLLVALVSVGLLELIRLGISKEWLIGRVKGKYSLWVKARPWASRVLVFTAVFILSAAVLYLFYPRRSQGDQQTVVPVPAPQVSHSQLTDASAKNSSGNNTSLPIRPFAINPSRIEPLDEETISTAAQYAAANINNCLATHPQTEDEAASCAAVYGTDVVSVRDDLHNHGIEVGELNAVVEQLESNPTAQLLRQSSTILRAIADRLRLAARTTQNSAHRDQKQLAPAPVPDVHSQRQTSIEPIPESASIALPERINLSKFELESLSTSAGSLSTEIKVCLARNSATTDAAGLCNYVYADQVARIRNSLRNAEVTIEALQDIVRRMERGANADELNYAATVLDLLSQELGKRAK